MSKDLQGRAYATPKDIVEGALVEVDGGFDCMEKGDKKVVHVDTKDGAYIKCDCGQHFLGPQRDVTKSFYVGIYPAEMETT